MAKVLGVDYTSRVSAFFTTLGLSKLFLMPESYKSATGHRILHAIGLFLNLPHIVREYKVIVFICPPYFHLPSLLLLKTLGIKTISIVVDLYGETAVKQFWQSPPHKRILRKLMYPFYELSEILSIKLSDAVFCVSAYSVGKYGRFKKKVYRVLNGADVAEISEIKPMKFEKETIFYMGGFLRWRGVDLLVNAFKTVQKKRDAQLVLMGGSEEELRYYPELQALLAKSKDIVLVGYSQHALAISYLKGAKIAVMPARDSFMTRVLSSVKVFEYVAAEVPQVCTDTGEHAQWVRKLDAGLVVKDTSEEIAMGISALLDDKNLYEKIRGNCRERKWEIDNKVLKEPLTRYFESIKNLG